MNIDREVLKSITILYVEDDKKIKDALISILDRMVKKIFTASDGEDGLETFIKYQDEIDIVISDINMPRKNGLDMMRDILKIKYVPTIITTAYMEQEYLLNTIDLGIDKYITKPIKTKDLIVNIELLVSFHRQKLQKEKATKSLLNKSKEINQESKELKEQINSMSIKLQLLENLVNTYIITLKTDKNAIITEVSLKFCNLYGYSKDEIIGKRITTIQDEQSSGNEIQKYMLEALHNKQSISAVHNFKTKAGKKLKCDMIMIPYFAEDGYVDGYAFYQDIISS